MLILFFIVGCCSLKQIPEYDDFFTELSSENNRLYGLLSLTVPDKDLSYLTYDAYIKYLKKNKVSASENLVCRIESADEHYFEASKRSFIIILYFKKGCRVVVDAAETTFIDFVETPDNCKNVLQLEEYKKRIQNNR